MPPHHVLFLPFVYGKISSKKKFDKKNEKCGEKKKNSQRRLNNNSVAIKHFQGNSVLKNPPANAEDMGKVCSIPGSERSLGVGNGNPLQYSCLGNSKDRRAWRTTAHWRHKELDMTEQHSTQQKQENYGEENITGKSKYIVKVVDQQ